MGVTVSPPPPNRPAPLKLRRTLRLPHEGGVGADYILVIKHGALGDVVLATGPFAAIRAHHPEAHIVLLSTAPYAALLKDSPYFDEIWVDTRPKLWQVAAWVRLWRLFRRYPFARVYDLQTSARSSQYWRLFPSPKPEWSGICKGASHRHDSPQRVHSHTIERQKAQLAITGITEVPPPDVSWLTGTMPGELEEGRYALLVPGGSAHRPEKRWPATHYAELAIWLAGQGVCPVLIGAGAEEGLLSEIESMFLRHCKEATPTRQSRKRCHPAFIAGSPKIRREMPQQVRHDTDAGLLRRSASRNDETFMSPDPSLLNLCNQTRFADIATLARSAVLAVGNDTGPMHLIAASGCPSLVLFSSASNPDLCAPRGTHVQVLQKESLAALEVAAVTEVIGESCGEVA